MPPKRIFPSTHGEPTYQVTRDLRGTVLGGSSQDLDTWLVTQSDGLEKVSPFRNGNFWYLC